MDYNCNPMASTFTLICQAVYDKNRLFGRKFLLQVSPTILVDELKGAIKEKMTSELGHHRLMLWRLLILLPTGC